MVFNHHKIYLPTKSFQKIHDITSKLTETQLTCYKIGFIPSIEF